MNMHKADAIYRKFGGQQQLLSLGAPTITPSHN